MWLQRSTSGCHNRSCGKWCGWSKVRIAITVVITIMMMVSYHSPSRPYIPIVRAWISTSSSSSLLLSLSYHPPSSIVSLSYSHIGTSTATATRRPHAHKRWIPHTTIIIIPSWYHTTQIRPLQQSLSLSSSSRSTDTVTYNSFEDITSSSSSS